MKDFTKAKWNRSLVERRWERIGETEDIKEMTPDVLNHRIILTYEAEADNISTLQIIQTILSSVAINR